jgi:uncharacterized NAD(P)/FAD-binding protein YdhS
MPKALFTVCVIGGGFTGLAAAIACLARLHRPFRLVVVEPSASLGRGVAYGAHHPLHLLNVRTRDLSIRVGQPGDFLNWAFLQLDQGENHEGLHEALAHTFLPRQLFGEYVRQRFFEAVETRRDVELKIVNAAATGVIEHRRRFHVQLDNAPSFDAEIVLLATAYGLASATNAALLPFTVTPPERLAKARSMALIGSGLTMVDVLLSARREGFQGEIKVISRRGQLPRPHAARGVAPQPIALPRFKRVSGITSAVAIACEVAEAHGTPWQAIMNGLRSSLQEIWQGLSVAEQSRFLRHVRPFWDAHRHRLPLEVHARVQAEFSAGRAVLLRGRITHVARDGDAFRLTLKPRGAAAPQTMTTDLAIDCTGHRPDLGSPLIQNLISRGFAREDAHRLGLSVLRDGQVLGKSGAPTPGLFALGPLGQGSLWEITAVPEIVAQCDAAAQSIAVLQDRAESEMALASL